jgi:hypothetical protein
MSLSKIVSGGQTGCDFAGLVAAKDLGLETGGFVPKGFKISFPNSKITSNPYLKLYGLTEVDSEDYRIRTFLNVENSDATLWVGKTSSAGYRCTFNAVIKYDKPSLVNPTSEELRGFVGTLDIKTLNVAGNREHTYPGIFIYTYLLLMDAFYDK